MASSTLLYIAWPLTLGLSFMAGSIDLSNESAAENSEVGNQPAEISHRDSFSHGSTNKNSTAINRRYSTAHSRAYAESYDINEIATTKDSQKRLTKLLGMIDQLGLGDFEQLVTDFPNEHSNDEYTMLLEAWAKINPRGALVYAKESPKYLFSSNTILRTWAGYAPDEAIQWVKLNHDGSVASRYLLNVVIGISSTNPERAKDMLHELSSYSDRRVALHTITPHVSKLSTEKIIAWFATIKDEKLHATATKSLISSLAKKDPQAATHWLKILSVKNPKMHADSTAFRNNINSIAHAWAKQDLDKAVEWTSTLKGRARASAAQRVMIEFIFSDPDKAAAWMKTMSGEPHYDNIVETFMYKTVRDHPELALANLDQIDKESNRKDTRQRSLTSWITIDKAAATQWMKNNNISATAQKKILSSTANGYDSRRW